MSTKLSVTKATGDYENLWQQCLDNIRKQYDKDDASRKYFNDWFTSIGYESYNPDTHELRLRLPSRFLYLFIEYYGYATLYSNIRSTFGANARLSYRIMPPKPNYSDMAAFQRQQVGISSYGPVHIHIDNARERLEEGLRYYLKDKPMKWLHGYDKVVKFLDDNDSRGLLVVGAPGLGKSLICCKILPVLLSNGIKEPKVVRATELNKRLEELKQERVVIIDDLGKEPRKHYGDIDQSFYELCDNAECTGAILIITTNLSTTPTDDPHYQDSIENRYGDAVISRLQAITHVAIIEGESLRQ